MKVVIAEQAGVCFGVKRALDIVAEQVRRPRPLSTLGPLIHNPQVVRSLQEQGVRVARSVADADAGALVMPSHGASSETIREARESGLEVVDATCPFVATVHRRVAKLASDGYEVVVVGDPGHSEVKAILSAAGEGAAVVSCLEDAAGIDWSEKRVGVVCQTTQTPERFGEVVGYIVGHAKEVLAHNTICYATHERQQAARQLAPTVDAVFVVGGRNSANTNRLAEICAESGKPVYHIETSDEIDPEWVKGLATVGLTAGASTPDWIIEDVRARLEGM